MWGPVFLLLLLGQLPPAQARTACPLDHADATASVSYVFDGDTVKLDDGRKLRFIGINAPEIDHQGDRSEPFSREARQRVRELVGNGRIRIRFGEERRDRYGRLLGHPYLLDGRSLAVVLLQEGLATTLVVPPNTWNQECYQALEREAREQKIGIWSLPRYQAIGPGELDKRERGYRLIAGVLEQVVESRNSIWLELRGPMALRIPRADLPLFAGINLKGQVGRRLLARGWPHLHKGKWRMTIRHPSALELE